MHDRKNRRIMKNQNKSKRKEKKAPWHQGASVSAQADERDWLDDATPSLAPWTPWKLGDNDNDGNSDNDGDYDNNRNNNNVNNDIDDSDKDTDDNMLDGASPSLVPWRQGL